MEGRQRRRYILGDADIVNAEEGHLLGNRPLLLIEGLQGADGERIAGDAEGSRHPLAQLLDGLETDPVALLDGKALGDEDAFFLEQLVIGHRLAERPLPDIHQRLVGRHIVIGAADEADGGMPLLHIVIDNLPDHGFLIGLHAVEQAFVGIGIDKHALGRNLPEMLDLGLVEPADRDKRRDVLMDRGNAGLLVVLHDIHIAAAGLLKHLAQDGLGEHIVELLALVDPIEQGDVVDLRINFLLLVAGLFGGLEDGGPRLFADRQLGVIVEHPRDGRIGETEHFGDLLDGCHGKPPNPGLSKYFTSYIVCCQPLPAASHRNLRAVSSKQTQK